MFFVFYLIVSTVFADSILQQFERDGFLVIEKFLTIDECESLRLEGLKIATEHAPDLSQEVFNALKNGMPQELFYFLSGRQLCLFFHEEAFDSEGALILHPENAVSKISYALHTQFPLISQFCRQEKLISLMKELGLQNPLLVQSMFIFKQPKSKGVHCHQDGTFIYTEPDTTIGLWFALEDANCDNGCIYVIPGGHHTPLKYRLIVNDGKSLDFVTLDDSPWELEKMVPLEVPKGSLIVMHSRLPHLSHPNLSERSRAAFVLHAMDASSDFPSDNWLPRPQEKIFN